MPEKLDVPAQDEWRQQSKWLEKQADRLDDLVDEIDRLLKGQDLARTELAYFDYQRIKTDIGFVVDGMQGKAENYAVKGKAAAQRQKKSVKIIARAD